MNNKKARNEITVKRAGKKETIRIYKKTKQKSLKHQIQNNEKVNKKFTKKLVINLVGSKL